MWKQNKIDSVLLLILLISGTFASAQNLYFVQNGESNNLFGDQHFAVELYGNGYQESNAISNGFVNDYITGNYITTEAKDKVSDDLTDINRLGVGYNFGLNFYIAPDTLFKSNDVGIKIGLSSYQQTSAKFGSDYFDLAFYGNKPFEGKTADLSNSGLYNYLFQKVSFGIFDKNTMSGVSLSFINGSQFTQFSTDDASLYTETSGEYLSFSADGYLWQSDTANIGYMVSNGIGATIDFNLNFPVFLGTKNPTKSASYIKIEVNNLGFIQWNKNTLNYQFDSTIVYEGYYVDNLFDTEDLSFDSEGLIDSLIPQNGKSSHYMPTPANFSLSWYSHLSNKFHYELQLRGRMNSYYLPQGTVRLLYEAHKNILVGANTSYGGYSLFQGGLFASARIKKNFLLQLETQCFSGLFSSKAKNRNLFVNLMYMF